MKNDALLKQEGLNILKEKLGLVDMERFIVLLNREKFDYTKLQDTAHDLINKFGDPITISVANAEIVGEEWNRQPGSTDYVGIGVRLAINEEDQTRFRQRFKDIDTEVSFYERAKFYVAGKDFPVKINVNDDITYKSRKWVVQYSQELKPKDDIMYFLLLVTARS